MTPVGIAGAVLIAGSIVFLVGAQIGVPKVFLEREPEIRLRILDQNRGRWRAAQPLYGLGPVMAAIGAGLLAAAAPAGGATRAFLWLAAAALLAGSLAWAWSVYLRAVRISDFALGRLPGWPFAAYVLLTIGGVAALGIGLLTASVAPWLVALTLAADAVFIAIYLRSGDIPPFVFYVLLLVVGAFLVASPAALRS
jgi:hypothetical protein